MKNVTFLSIFFLFCILACKKEDPTTVPGVKCELNNFPSINSNGKLYVSEQISSTPLNSIEAATDFCLKSSFEHCDAWYLPSKEELDALYQNKSTLGIGKFNTYWSSTRSGDYNVWIQDFTTGQQKTGLQFPYPSPGHYCLCVRR